MEVLLSVIVCTFNRENLLPGCLESLVNQTLSKSSYEVIIVNNNSVDSTHEIAQSYVISQPNFCLVNEEKQGLSHARNRGWQEARGQYVAYIDDDAKADPEWCQKILDSFNTVNPKPVAVGGRIMPWYETTPPDWFVDDFEIRTWGDEKGFLQPPRAPYGFSGSNMAFPVEILKKHGGFSPDFGMAGKKMRFGEETALFIKIYQENSCFWYDPSIKVNHWVPVRNMKIRYRFKRSFKSAISTTAINRDITDTNSLTRLFIWLCKRMLRLILTMPVMAKLEFVKNGQDVAYHSGVFLCKLRYKFNKQENRRLK